MNPLPADQADRVDDWISHIERCVKSTWYKHMTTLCELEDLTQEVLLRFIEIWTSFDTAKCHREAWIAIKAKHICFDLVRDGIVSNAVVRVPRRGKKTKTIHAVPDRAKVDSKLSRLEHEEELLQTAKELGNQDLTESECEFLRLVHARDYTVGEAATAVGRNRVWAYTGIYYRLQHGHRKPNWKKAEAAAGEVEA